MQVAEVKRLIKIGKEQFDYLSHKLDRQSQDEYHLNMDDIADAFVQMLCDDENDY